MNALVLESDRIISKCIADEFGKRNIRVKIASNADSAISLADEQKPVVVICELSLHSHSGSEFLYEFRTYDDWQDIPIIIFSSIEVPRKIIKSKDWQLLKISRFMYKPDVSLQQLGEQVESLILK